MNRSIQMFELGFRLKLQFLGQDEHETDAKKWTLTNSISDFTNPLEMVKETFQAFESINSDVRARI